MLGAQAFQLAALATQLEAAQARIAELEKAAAEKAPAA